MTKWDGEWCGRCDRRNVMGWSVSNEAWDRVVKERWDILCPSCFDELAEEQEIRYLFDEDVYPVSWSEW